MPLTAVQTPHRLTVVYRDIPTQFNSVVMHAHHLRMCEDTSFVHTPHSPSIHIWVISSPHGPDLSRPRRSSASIESLPLIGAAAGIFANLLPTGVCRKAFSRSEARSCISSLPAHRALTKFSRDSSGPITGPGSNWSVFSIQFSAAYEQSATSPIFGTSNHCLCRRTSPVQLISVLWFRRHRQSLSGPDLAIFIDNQQSIQDPEAAICCWY
jgi:hypothetical protein